MFPGRLHCIVSEWVIHSHIFQERNWRWSLHERFALGILAFAVAARLPMSMSRPLAPGWWSRCRRTCASTWPLRVHRRQAEQSPVDIVSQDLEAPCSIWKVIWAPNGDTYVDIAYMHKWLRLIAHRASILEKVITRLSAATMPQWRPFCGRVALSTGGGVIRRAHAHARHQRCMDGEEGQRSFLPCQELVAAAKGCSRRG